MSTTRKLHHWKARIALRDGGETQEKDVYSYWDPEKFEDTAEQIAVCAAAEHNTFVDKRRGAHGEFPWVGVSAALVRGKKASA